MPEVGQTTTIVGVGLHRLVIPSTFIANVSDSTLKVPQEPVILAEFNLGKGAWVVHAKAIVRAVGGQFDPDTSVTDTFVRVQLSLVAQTDDNALLDKSIVEVTWAGATVVAMLGIQASKTILLSLRANNLVSVLPGRGAEITDIVISAIKQDELITIAY